MICLNMHTRFRTWKFLHGIGGFIAVLSLWMVLLPGYGMAQGEGQRQGDGQRASEGQAAGEGLGQSEGQRVSEEQAALGEGSGEGRGVTAGEQKHSVTVRLGKESRANGKDRSAVEGDRGAIGANRLGLRAVDYEAEGLPWRKLLVTKFSPQGKQRANPTTMIIVGFFMVFFWMLLLIGALISSAVSGGFGMALLAVLLFPTLITGIVLLILGLAYN
jgi:hypothetical protein